MALTKQDVIQIKSMVEVTLEAKLEEKFNEKFAEVNKNFSHLPTKQEFFDYMDKLMTEVKNSRQEQAVNSHRITQIEQKIAI